jgi:hypothetical protein
VKIAKAGSASKPGSARSEDEGVTAPSTTENESSIITALDDLDGAAIQLALDGDAKAGMDVLRSCVEGLRSGDISEQLRLYLADRIAQVVDGVPPQRALGVEIVRDGVGRPQKPFPDWEYPLAALGALLAKRNYKPARIAEAMDELRSSRSGKNLDPKEAREIQKKYAGMKQLDERTLVAICEALELRGEMEKFSPLPKK